jgi:tripartite-type tricarboxylate transporter receptor subunit TctC
MNNSGELMRRVFFRRGCAAAVLLTLSTTASADAVTDFYKDKTLSIVVGHEAGTGYDIYARTLARHIGQHIPGKPNVVPQNMPGAGGLNAANWLYNVAPKDGLAMAMFATEAAFQPLFGSKLAKFDPVKFSWIGNLDESVATCVVSERSGITSLEQMFQRETLIGATGATSPTSSFAFGLANFVGAKLKIVQGYKGSADLKIAMQRGEIEGACGVSLSTLKSQWRDDLQSGRARPIIQFSLKKSPELPGIAHVYDYAKSAEDRELFDIAFGLHVLGRPVLAPPALPAERLRALREAFMKTVQNPEFIADVEKLGLSLTPSSGEEVEPLVARFFSYPASTIEKARAGVHPKH